MDMVDVHGCNPADHSAEVCVVEPSDLAGKAAQG